MKSIFIAYTKGDENEKEEEEEDKEKKRKSPKKKKKVEVVQSNTLDSLVKKVEPQAQPTHSQSQSSGSQTIKIKKKIWVTEKRVNEKGYTGNL